MQIPALLIPAHQLLLHFPASSAGEMSTGSFPALFNARLQPSDIQERERCLERDEGGKALFQSSQCSLSDTITFYPQLEEEGRMGSDGRNPLSCLLNGHNTTLGSKHIFL